MKISRLILKNWPLVLIFFVVIYLLRSFINPGLPLTHDINNHLARVANFYIAIKDLHFPPRWAANLNYKFGYPVFNYMYYFPYIPAVPLYVIGLSFEQSFKIVVFLFYLVGGIYFYYFLKKHCSKLAAMAGTILFLSSPAHLLQFFVRGNIGELVAWLLIPVILYYYDAYADQINKNQSSKKNLLLTSFLIYFLLISHNSVYAFSIPLFIIYFLAKYLSFAQKSLKKLLYLFFPIVISFAIGAYFFIPAVFETHYTTIDGVAISHQFDDHYPSFNQLILSPWGHAYSEVGPKDGMSFEISRIIFILVIIYLFYQVHDFIKNRKIQPLSFSLLLVYFASIYLMTSSSLWFWNIFSFLKQMQFPWRLLFIPVISGSILSTFLFNKFNSRLLIIACITLSLVFAYRYSIPQGYLNQPDIMYLEFPFSSSLNHEQLSRDFHYDKNSEYKQQLKDLAGYAHFDINTWKTAYHHYQVESTQSAHIVEHVMYFPGWKTFANDKPSDIIYDHPDYPGIITFKLPAGSHTIITKFTNDTPARRLGNSISLLTLITITLILFRKPKLK